jgi:hypothetical protein
MKEAGQWVSEVTITGTPYEQGDLRYVPLEIRSTTGEPETENAVIKFYQFGDKTSCFIVGSKEKGVVDSHHKTCPTRPRRSACRTSQVACKAHLVRGDKAQLLVQGTAVGGGVENQAVELCFAGPGEDLLHQAASEALSTKGWLGIDVERDRLPTFSHIHPAVGSATRKGHDATNLYARPRCDVAVVTREARQPADVLAPGNRVAKIGEAFRRERIDHFRRCQTHR